MYYERTITLKTKKHTGKYWRIFPYGKSVFN